MCREEYVEALIDWIWLATERGAREVIQKESKSRMGSGESKPVVLGCMIKNFRKGFGGDYGGKLTQNKLRSFCEIDWPSFGVGRLSEGALVLDKVQAVYSVATGRPSHLISSCVLTHGYELHKTHPLEPRYVILEKEKARFFWCRQNPSKKS